MSIHKQFQMVIVDIGISLSNEKDKQRLKSFNLPCKTAVTVVLCLFVLLFCSSGCVRGPSFDDVERSHREVELAAALHRENNIPGAIGHLRTALELDSDNAEAHLLFAVIQHINRRNSILAEEHARRGVDLLIDQERYGAMLAEARNILGSILITREQYDAAIEELRKSALDDMNTSPHLAWGNLGQAYLESGRPAEALEPLKEAVRVQPRFCVGFHRLGKAYFELNRLVEAEDALIRALETDDACSTSPLMQNAWRLRGEVRARLGRRSDALADLERCVALGPESSDGEVCQRLLDGPYEENSPPNIEEEESS